jgi:hypothetical protein
LSPPSYLDYPTPLLPSLSLQPFHILVLTLPLSTGFWGWNPRKSFWNHKCT